MADARFVAERCHARFQGREDLMSQVEYVCQFHAGHQGLHYSEVAWRDHGEQSVEPSMRWGTEEQLREEMFLGAGRLTIMRGN
jgi:hypothetical protein